MRQNRSAINVAATPASAVATRRDDWSTRKLRRGTRQPDFVGARLYRASHPAAASKERP